MCPAESMNEWRIDRPYSDTAPHPAMSEIPQTMLLLVGPNERCGILGHKITAESDYHVLISLVA